MKWWARIGSGYGRWVPTGCIALDDAKFYIESIYRGGHVIEWLQM